MSAKGYFVYAEDQLIDDVGTWDTTETGQGVLRDILFSIRNESSGDIFSDADLSKLAFQLYVDGEGAASTSFPFLMLGGIIPDHSVATPAAWSAIGTTTEDAGSPFRYDLYTGTANFETHTVFRRDLRIPFDTSLKIEIENSIGGGSQQDARLVFMMAQIAMV